MVASHYSAMMTTDYQNQAALLLKEFTLPATLIPCLSITCGIFACKKIYDISRLISSAFIKVYSGLSRKQQIEWNNRVISTVHAIFITIMSVYLTFWSDLYTDNETTGLLIFQKSALSTFVLGVSIGYFLSDLGMIFWFYPTLGGMEYVLHHLLSMSALVYAMLFGEGQFYVYLVLISETTTPSINLRWYLDAVGLRRSKAYVVNGVVIFFTWLVARILLFMYLFYHLITHYDQVKQLPPLGYGLVLVTPTVISALNLMWFAKITRGMLKTLTKRH